MKARTNQTQTIIDDANYFLKANEITSPDNDLFIVLTNSLIRMDIYRGFQYCKRNWFNTVDPETGLEYMASADVSCPEEECQFLQIL